LYFDSHRHSVQFGYTGVPSVEAYIFSLSFPVRGVGHWPDLLQEVPEASRIRVTLSSWPDVPPGLVVSWTLAPGALLHYIVCIK